MSKLKIADIITQKRRSKNITQEELAEHMGVSKAAVSKWEKQQSYPDISLLPQLASYFNISIDELMGYQPQMSVEDIHRLYAELSMEFSTKPFDEVISRCRDIVKKYYSCFPLVFRMGILYMNYGYTIAKDEEQKNSALSESKELFIRVKDLSEDIGLKQAALQMEATCELMLGNSDTVIELLKNVIPPPSPKGLLAQAHLMKGNVIGAKTKLQESMYFGVHALFSSITPYLEICLDDELHFQEICKRAENLIEIFNMKEIALASILPFYLAAARGYVAFENYERALDLLEEYAKIITSGIYPLKPIKGDEFFSLIGDSTEAPFFGSGELPRDEKSIKQSMVDLVVKNPVFAVLKEDPRFVKIVDIISCNTLRPG